MSSLLPLNHLMVVAGLLAMAVQFSSISSPSTAISFWMSMTKLRGGTTTDKSTRHVLDEKAIFSPLTQDKTFRKTHKIS